MFNNANGFGVTPNHLQSVINTVIKSFETQRKKRASPAEMNEMSSSVRLAYDLVRKTNSKIAFSMSEAQEDAAAKTIIKKVAAKFGITL
jgi:hypothetical protein